MKKIIQNIKAFYQRNKTLLIILAVIKLLAKIALVGWLIFGNKEAKGQSTNKLLREGNAYYNKEKYNNSTESYSKALQTAPKDVRANFNQGDALYKLNEWDKSKEHFANAATHSTNTDIQARAYYNIGNALYKQEKYEESLKAYKQSLKLNPKDEDAKYNLMMAMAKIKKENSGEKENKQNKKDDKKNQQQPNQGNQKQDPNGQPQNQQEKEKQQQQQSAQQKGQLSNEEAQKLLDAISAEESKVQQKLTKEKGKPVKVKTNKDW